MLSKENYDKLNENYLYKREPIIREPIIDNSFYVGNTPGTYHCKNWTFKAHKYENGRVFMNDTYFGDNNRFEVTDNNINDFEFVFDFREVRKIRDSENDEYNEEDLYYVATDSRGYSCGGCYWIKKDTKKSKELLIKKKKLEIKSLENHLKWAEDDLKRLENDN